MGEIHRQALAGSGDIFEVPRMRSAVKEITRTGRQGTNVGTPNVHHNDYQPVTSQRQANPSC
jgi:hypothetical protein